MATGNETKLLIEQNFKHKLNDLDTINFPAKAVAFAYVAALFPAGEKIPAGKIVQILQAVHQYLQNKTYRWLILWLSLQMIALHALLITRRQFILLTPEERENYLAVYQHKFFIGTLLQVLSKPFKFAYLQATQTKTALNTRQQFATPQKPSSQKQARWLQQIADVASFENDEQLSADVIVIGSGAGGAAAAYELASRGLAVLIVEEGQYYGRHEFTGNIPEMLKKLYRFLGTTAAIGSGVIPIPIGKSVGGTTTINSGTCMRTPPEVLQQWQQQGLTALTEAELKPYFEQVEQHIGVNIAEMKYVGPIASVIASGAQLIGLKTLEPLKRNAIGCDGQGLCQFGCPSGAKQSTNESLIPKALENGAFMLTGFTATDILWRGNQVIGLNVSGKQSNGKVINLTINANHVVIAMGSLLTPQFLTHNGVKNRQLGKNLSIHPAGAVAAFFPDKNFANTFTIPQGFGINDLADEGILFEGATPPLLGYGLMMPYVGKTFVRVLERYQQTAFFGFMLKDTSRGRIFGTPFKRFPLIWYRMNQADFGRFKQGLHQLASLYFAAGAQEVHLAGCTKKIMLKSREELDQLMASPLKPADFFISAYHPLGTARIGVCAEQAVCDIDHQVFGTSGLYVMDGSSVPTALGANPQVTIMALALRAAAKLADKILAPTELSTINLSSTKNMEIH